MGLVVDKLCPKSLLNIQCLYKIIFKLKFKRCFYSSKLPEGYKHPREKMRRAKDKRKDRREE